MWWRPGAVREGLKGLKVEPTEIRGFRASEGPWERGQRARGGQGTPESSRHGAAKGGGHRNPRERDSQSSLRQKGQGQL